MDQQRKAVKSKTNTHIFNEIRLGILLLRTLQGPSDVVVYISFPQMEITIPCVINSGMASCVGDAVDQDSAMVTMSYHQ